MLSQLSKASRIPQGLPIAQIRRAAPARQTPRLAPKKLVSSLATRNPLLNAWTSRTSLRPLTTSRRYCTTNTRSQDALDHNETLTTEERQKIIAEFERKYILNVDRYGNPTPRLERLIDEFSTNFLEFYNLADIVRSFQDPNIVQAFMQRYKRPLKPLEYYFSDIELHNILQQRLHTQLISILPAKSEIIVKLESSTFFEQLKAQHGEESARKRQAAMVFYVKHYLDDRFQLRPLKSIEELMDAKSSHPLANLVAGPNLDQQLEELVQKGSIKSEELDLIRIAIRTNSKLPVESYADEFVRTNMEALDRLHFSLTPTPTESKNDASPSTILPYYERMRLEGRPVGSPARKANRRSSSTTKPSIGLNPLPSDAIHKPGSNSPIMESNGLKATVSAPAAWPFTALEGHIGRGVFVDIKDEMQARIEALIERSDPHTVKPNIRQWTALEKQRLVKIKDYTIEWFVANGVMPKPSGFSNSSGISWSELSFTQPISEERFDNIVQKTPITLDDGPSLSSTHEALRIIGQALAQSGVASITSLASSLASSPLNYSEIPIHQSASENASSTQASQTPNDEFVKEAFEAIHNLSLSLGSKTTSPQANQAQQIQQIQQSLFKHIPYSPNPIVMRSRELEELIKATTANDPPLEYQKKMRDYDLVSPGEPRTDKYTVEFDPWTYQDSNQLIVRCPIRRVDRSEHRAFIKIGWLILNVLGKMTTQQLATLFVKSGSKNMNLETLWEVRRVASQLAEYIQANSQPEDIPEDQLQSVLEKMALDATLFRSFLLAEFELVGINDYKSQRGAVKDDQSSRARVDLNGEHSSDKAPYLGLSSEEGSEDGFFPDGKLTDAKKVEIFERMTQALSEQVRMAERDGPRQIDYYGTENTHLVSPQYHDTLGSLEDRERARASNARERMAHMRRSKMEAPIADLILSLSGAEIRTLFPVDIIFLHPFLTTAQRSEALAPILAANPQLSQIASRNTSTNIELVEKLKHEASSKGKFYAVNHSRQTYLRTQLPDSLRAAIGKLEPQFNSDGSKTDFGSQVERIARLLEVPPMGLSLSIEEFKNALITARDKAETPKQTESINQLLPALDDPTVASMFAKGSEKSSPALKLLEDADYVKKMEDLIANGIPSHVNPDSMQYRNLKADIATYKNAKKIKLSLEQPMSEEEQKAEDLRQDLWARLVPIAHWIRSEARILVLPSPDDSYDLLLLKQDLIAGIERQVAEQKPISGLEQAYLQLDPNIHDADITLNMADGTRKIVRYNREDHMKALQDHGRTTLPQSPFSSIESLSKLEPTSSEPGTYESAKSMLFQGISESLSGQASSDNQPLSSSPLPFDQILQNMKNYQSMQQQKQRIQLESELNAIRDVFGAPARSLENTSMSEVRELVKSFLQEISTLDPLTVWEMYPELAPVVPEQAIKGPFREIFDFVTPSPTAIPVKHRHVLDQMKEGVTAWYLDREEEGKIPRVTLNPTTKDFEAVDSALAYQNDLSDWLRAYAFDLGFPIDKVKLYHDLIKNSPRLFRKMDFERDMATLKSFEDVAKILDTHESTKERIEWFKSHNKQLASMVENIRSLIGDDGEDYLKYNEMLMKRHRDKQLGTHGHKRRVYNVDHLDEDLAEMDNIDERILLQTILVFIRSSLDVTELQRLELVNDDIEYELWILWRVLRKERHRIQKQQRSESSDVLRKNDELPHGHPDKKYEDEELDRDVDSQPSTDGVEKVEEIMNAVSRVPLPTEENEVQSLDSLRTPLQQVMRSITPHSIARQKALAEEEANKAYWAEKRTIQLRSALGLPSDSESRLKDIMQLYMEESRGIDVSSSTPLTESENWIDDVFERLSAKVPEHIKSDPLFTEMVNSAKLKSSEFDEALNDMSKPLPEHLIRKHSEMIAKTPAEAERIAVALREIPFSKELPIADLKKIADYIYGSRKSREASEQGAEPSQPDLRKMESDLIDLFSSFATKEASGEELEDEDLLRDIEPRKMFPNVDWGDDIPFPSKEASSTTTTHSSSSTSSMFHPSSVSSPSLDSKPHSFSAVADPSGFDLLSSFQEALKPLIDSSNVASVFESSSTSSSSEAHKESWKVAYNLFTQVEVLSHHLRRSLTSFSKLDISAVQDDYLKTMEHCLNLPMPDFPSEQSGISPLKIIPWHKIQLLLGMNDRQLKTLMLFLANKEHYMNDKRSRPPKMQGFFWDFNEFQTIRNRFLGIRAHPSGEPSAEEKLHDMIFGDVSLAIEQRKQEQKSSVEKSSSGLPSSSSPHSISPSILEDMNRRIGNIEVNEEPMSRLDWARREAELNPLPTNIKLTPGQLALVKQGVNPSYFVDPSLPGLEKLVPVQRHLNLSNQLADEQEAIRRFEELSQLASRDTPEHQIWKSMLQSSAAAASSDTFSDGVVSAEITYFEGNARETIAKLLANSKPKQPKALTEANTEAGSSNVTSDGKGDAPPPSAEASESSQGNSSSSESSQEESKSEKGDGESKGEEEGEKKEGSEGEEAAQAPKPVDWVKWEKEAEEQARKEAERFVEFEESMMHRSAGDTTRQAPVVDGKVVSDYSELEESDDPFDTMNHALPKMITEESILKSLYDDKRAPYNMQTLENTEYLVKQRRQLIQLVMTKWTLLHKQMHDLDLHVTHPTLLIYTNILRTTWTNQLDLVFWNSAPFDPEHRGSFQLAFGEAMLHSKKFQRRLMVDMAPIIFGTQLPFIPKDNFGEVYHGLTPFELVGRNFDSSKQPLFPTPWGNLKPYTTMRPITDPMDRMRRDQLDAKQAVMDSRNPFSKQRRRYYALAAALAAAFGLGLMTYNFFQQDEDTAVDRIATEASIFKTRLIAAADRVGTAVMHIGSLFLNVGKGVAWIFTRSVSRIDQTTLDALNGDSSSGGVPSLPNGALLPPHLVKPETGGYHYYEWLEEQNRKETERKRQLIQDAYDLYERRATDPEVVLENKRYRAIIDNAVRLAQLRQYEKQKRDYANAQFKEPELPNMDDHPWFVMPENRYWDQHPLYRFVPPDAEKFWRRRNLQYHPDDNAPKVRILTPDEHLFDPDAKISKGGHVDSKGPNPWLARRVDDLDDDDIHRTPLNK